MQTKKEWEKPAPQQTQKLSLPRRQMATLKSECWRTVATERDDNGLRPMQVCGVGPEPERPGPQRAHTFYEGIGYRTCPSSGLHKLLSISNC